MPSGDLDPYVTLGVGHDAPLLEIARARRRLAKQHHPDVASDGVSDRTMESINAAWELLSDVGRRREWDELHRARSAAHWSGRARGSAATTYGATVVGSAVRRGSPHGAMPDSYPSATGPGSLWLAPRSFLRSCSPSS